MEELAALSRVVTVITSLIGMFLVALITTTILGFWLGFIATVIVVCLNAFTYVDMYMEVKGV